MGIKIKIAGDYILIKDASAAQFAAIKSWGRLRWDSKEKASIGVASLETLDRLAELLRQDGLRLPTDAEKQRTALHVTRDAVDRERIREDPQPLTKYPVKMQLYQHQVRAANMALLTFGWIEPKGAGT